MEAAKQNSDLTVSNLDFKISGSKRSEAIDFLRGLAIILVLFRHHRSVSYLFNMGWIGVDLFFVLSGFLVSSLLFKEYQIHGNIKPGLFLIRRGFKIYPLFYFAILVTFIQKLFFPHAYFFDDSHLVQLNFKGIAVNLLVEVLFLQSYFLGFWGHHWSLSVEEFFYFSLTILLYYSIRSKRLTDFNFVIKSTAFIICLCLLLRVLSNILFPHTIINFSGFHLRFDSLFSGVFIAYLYHFRREALENFYKSNRKSLWAIIIPLISFTPFLDSNESVFVKTIGFTLIFISFDVLLITFLFEKNITIKLRKVLSNVVFSLFVKIGFYSYGIYLFHTYILRYVIGENYENDLGLFSFPLYFFGAIILGIAMSRLIEVPMLRLRDRLFPRRSVL